MKFNTAKCHILSITRQRYKVKPTYTLNSDTLSNVDSYPYLGVTITADLRWREHVQLTASKATRTLNFVRRNIYSCTPECKSLAYTFLVRPLMEYACPAWDPYRTRDITLLESVQRRAARFVHSDYRYSTSVSTLLNQLEWPPLKERRQQARLTLFSKALTNDSVISLSHLSHPSRTTRTLNETCFIPISTRTDVYKFAFIPRTILDWNSASQDFRTKSLQPPPDKVESHQ